MASKCGHVEIGAKRMVRRYDGTWHPGEIIESRLNESTNTREYYVHFDEMNRRLDEWVTAERIDSREVHEIRQQVDAAPVVAPPSTEERRKTRTQRRLEDGLTGPGGELSPTHYHPTSSAAPTPSTTAAIDTPTAAKSIGANATASSGDHEQKVKYVDKIQLGSYEIDTWYFSPYPDEYCCQQKLWLCEYCLRYMRLEMSFRRHLAECEQRQPPGKRIYSHANLAVYEVDGVEHKLYSQCLCLLAKLFLDHKTLYYDVEPFLFYILCEVDEHGAHIVGYFSKEKQSAEGNNVACILTLPPHQRKGYGKFLIALSYELSKIENVAGQPEKPLSDLGRLSYRSYWTWALLEALRSANGTVSIRDLSRQTGIMVADIVSTLQVLGLVRYWKGQYVISVTPRLIEELMRSPAYRPPTVPIVTSALRWIPTSTTGGCSTPGASERQGGGAASRYF